MQLATCVVSNAVFTFLARMSIAGTRTQESNEQCDGNQCCPQFWRNSPGSDTTVRVDRLTAQCSPVARVVPRGRSQLVESFVCLVMLVRIDRLIALSLDSMDHGAWPFFGDGVTRLVNFVSM